MDSAPKQERSKKRIQTILETAEAILLEENVDAITIAKISKLSGLKRTSTSSDNGKPSVTTSSSFRLSAQRYDPACGHAWRPFRDQHAL